MTPGDGALTIETAGEGASATGSFTANQSGASTLTLPTIRYGDLSGKPTIPAAAGNGTITVTQPGTTDQTFTVNQSGNTTIALKNDNTVVTPGNGALTIRTAGEGASSTGTFTANQSSGSILTLPTIRYTDLSGKPTIPAAANNGALTIKTAGEGASGSGSFTANQSGNSTITLPTIRYGDLSGRPSIPSVGNGTITVVQPGTSNQTFTVNQSGNTTITLKNDNNTYTVGNGALTIKTAGQGASATGSYTANQTGGSTLTLPTIRYQDISGTPTITGQYLSRTGADTGVGPLTSNNGWKVGSGFGTTTWDASGSVISWKGDTAGQIYRFTPDDTTKNSAGFSSDFTSLVQIASSTGGTTLQAYRHNPTGGATTQYSRTAVFANKADNVNLTGGNLNSSNTPGCISTQFKFSPQTICNNFNFYNVQSCLSSTPGSISAIDEINCYYAPKAGIGYNDGTSDQSLKNTKIRGFHTGLDNDGTIAGSTQCWQFYGSGNAPSYFGGLVRASQGIDFSTDKDAVSADANETLEHYEKGTYTPVLNSSGGATYSARSGSYLIIGNVIHVLVDMTYSGASGTGQISLSLPVASSAITGNLSGLTGSVYIHNASSGLTMPIAATIGNSQTTALLIKAGVRTQSYNNSRVVYNDATSGQLRFSVSYYIA